MAGRKRWALALVVATVTVTAGAQTAPAEAREFTVYAAKGVDSNLTNLPGQVLRGDLPWESSTFVGVGIAWPVETPSMLKSALRAVHVDNATTAIEVVGVKHSGLQTNFESGAVFMLRSPYGQLGPVMARVGAGIGLSYAFGRPTYEDGPENDPQRRYRLQNFNSFELELGLVGYPSTRLVTRVHHRSGFYGLLAPRRVGSNFIAIGVRMSF